MRAEAEAPVRILNAAQAPHTLIDGRPVISLSSNNYLGLITHAQVRQAFLAGLRRYGVGSGGAQSFAGSAEPHERLERRIAEFKKTEAALTFESGFAANIGVIPALAGEGDLIVSDARNHASIVDGVRLSRAAHEIYPHADMDALEAILERARAERSARRSVLIVTDGVFSMDGEIARLPEICRLARRSGATVMVDDAHGTGVLGPGGRGTVEHFGLEGQVEVQVGTFSKAFGVSGGYVVGAAPLRHHLALHAKPFRYSTAQPPAVAAACAAAIDVVEAEPQRIERLWANARAFKDGLVALGFDIGASETPITPVIVRDTVLALRFSERLLDAGVFAQPVVPPAVPQGAARLRTIVTSEHTAEDLRQCLETFGVVGRDLGIVG